MGGKIALRLALRYPERVRGLILNASSGYVKPSGRPLERLLRRVPGVGALIARLVVMNRGFADRSLRAGYWAGDRVTDTDVSAYLLPARVPGTAGVECGHLPHEEHPEAFNRRVIDFLASLGAAGG